MNTLEILAELAKRRNYNKLRKYRPYGHPDTLCPDGKLWKAMLEAGQWVDWSNRPWQLDFHNAGKNNIFRLEESANGVGKTEEVSAEVAIHMTGQYPDWWAGHVFEKPVKVWLGSISNEAQKDGLQPGLLGPDLSENLGSGYIPRANILGKVKIRQAGIADVADSFQVRHKSGGVSTAQFKTYKQGWRLWQGGKPDIIALDEQPDESNNEEKGIFSEIHTRLVRSQGIFIAGLTPLLGDMPLTEFFDNNDELVWSGGADWNDAPHLTPERRALAVKGYMPHEIATRTKGVRMRGEGMIFPVPEESIKTEPFRIPDHWARIKGIDFGIDHPAAVVDLVWDRDSDTVYITRSWKQSTAPGEDSIANHCAAINIIDEWVPVAWPHDGGNRQSDGKRLWAKYAAAPYRTNMMGKSARYPKGPGEEEDKGGAQPVWPIIKEIYERMLEGQFKVFSTCDEWFREFRSYHMKNGKPIDRKDDVLKASMYALMMKRYAVSGRARMPRNRHVSAPAISVSI